MPDLPDVPAAPAPGICPLCGGDNACGLVAGRDTCWCFETAIPAAAIARVPAEAIDRSCICQACAAASVLPAAPASEAPDER